VKGIPQLHALAVLSQTMGVYQDTAVLKRELIVFVRNLRAVFIQQTHYRQSL
jgi:hypothetical protein